VTIWKRRLRIPMTHRSGIVIGRSRMPKMVPMVHPNSEQMV
jgi:hypothetical protein